MLDLLIIGGTVVDGTGAEPRRADIGVRDGVISTIAEPGSITEEAARTIDATNRVIAPGFIDLHTHYDAQLLWDPTAGPSPLHGVTTVLGGNCGFTIAPLADGDADWVMRMMARVEGMPLETLRQGPAWDWHTFGEWLSRLDGHLAVNAGFLVGHSTVRRAVMGEAATDAVASAEQIAAMVELVHEALASGALGFSSSLGEAHTDGDGRPIPSRAAAPEEFLALAAAVGDHEGTTIEFIPAVGEIPLDRIELMTGMSLAANRPLNWNLLGSLSPTEIFEQQLTASDHATAHGARVVALTLPDLMRLRASRMLNDLPGWRDVIRLPDDERRAAIRDPEVRQRLHDGAAQASARGLAALADWDLIELADGLPADSSSASVDQYIGRTIASIAAELDADPVDVLIDMVLPDRLPLTMVLPSLVPSLGSSDEGWVERAKVWTDDRVVLGGSDAGAHLDLMCHANYTTVVLGEAVRDRGVISLAEAVRQLTDVPARLYGLTGRGRVVQGWIADLVVFDPATVGSDPARARHDLPGGGYRLFAESRGIDHVFVGGTEAVRDGAMTGELGGTLLRSGRDTETVTVPGTAGVVS